MFRNLLDYEWYETKILSRIEMDNNDCHIWTGQVTKDLTHGKRYPTVRYKERTFRVHIVCYLMEIGSVPVGLELDHTCRNNMCVMFHTEPVTHAVNMSRGAHTLKTHCPRGHPYDRFNTYVDKKGRRNCMECHRQSNDRARHRYVNI